MICPNQSNRGPLKEEKKNELKCGSLPTAVIVGAVGKMVYNFFDPKGRVIIKEG